MKNRLLLLVTGLIVANQPPVCLAGTPAKPMTIYDRQQILMNKINDLQKKQELTADEAKGLRKQLADVSRAKTKLKGKAISRAVKDKNNKEGPKASQLTTDDVLKMEKMLDGVSTKITELSLNKRVQKK